MVTKDCDYSISIMYCSLAKISTTLLIDSEVIKLQQGMKNYSPIQNQLRQVFHLNFRNNETSKMISRNSLRNTRLDKEFSSSMIGIQQKQIPISILILVKIKLLPQLYMTTIESSTYRRQGSCMESKAQVSLRYSNYRKIYIFNSQKSSFSCLNPM